MSRLAALLRPESGQAMMMVVFMTVVLSVLGAGLTTLVTSETQSSGHSVSSDRAYQAAEAGVDSYAAKLLDDQLYFLHWVASGESTRVSGSVTAHPGDAWSGGITWTYPNGQDSWHDLGNGYAYNLQITAPSGSATPIQQAVQIVATGCRWNSTLQACGTAANDAKRTIQTLLVPSSAANFQMIANHSISYNASSTTNGKVYVNGTLTHPGHASANLYAETAVVGPPQLSNGATTYSPSTTPSIRDVLPDPINFSDFLTSISDIQRAAQSGGVYLHQATAPAAWEVVFNADGTFTAAACSKVGTSDVALVAPTCGAATTYNVPTNGAVYSNETVIIGGTGAASSTVNGRVTVTSNNNIVIGNNIGYASGTYSVLGMVALNNVIVAYWTPNTLTWTGATIATNGYWADTCDSHTFGFGCGTHGPMTFTGSSATNMGGTMSAFFPRTYNYDPTLLWLTPPWFPTVGKPYTVLLQRELTSS